MYGLVAVDRQEKHGGAVLGAPRATRRFITTAMRRIPSSASTQAAAPAAAGPTSSTHVQASDFLPGLLDLLSDQPRSWVYPFAGGRAPQRRDATRSPPRNSGMSTWETALEAKRNAWLNREPHRIGLWDPRPISRQVSMASHVESIRLAEASLQSRLRPTSPPAAHRPPSPTSPPARRPLGRRVTEPANLRPTLSKMLLDAYPHSKPLPAASCGRSDRMPRQSSF